jgi:hypothetical protein
LLLQATSEDEPVAIDEVVPKKRPGHNLFDNWKDLSPSPPPSPPESPKKIESTPMRRKVKCRPRRLFPKTASFDPSRRYGFDPCQAKKFKTKVYSDDEFLLMLKK